MGRRRTKTARRVGGVVLEGLESRLVLAGGPANPYLIDLLVVYSTDAKMARGGDATIRELIQSAVDSTNEALYNTRVPITIRLVHTEEVDYTSSGDLYTDKVRLGDPNDGFLDSVPALRDQYGADLVNLITTGTQGGGSAYVPIDGYAQNDTLAFSAIDQNSIDKNNLTMAHELGHNLGAGHERDNVTQPAPGIFDYSYGYRFTGADGIVYHDIMSYDPGLGIPYYANPAITYAGVPEGKPAGDPQSADAATTFMLTAPMIAGYRPTKVADVAAPTAAVTSMTPNGNVLTFTVRYLDNSAVDVSSIGSNDVYVNTPEGFHLAAQLIGVDRPDNTYAKVATYRVTLPASKPRLSSLDFFVRVGEVKDVNGNAMPAGEVPLNSSDLAGWDFRTTRNLGVLPLSITMTDRLGPGDFDDIYSFTLTERRTVSFTMTGMTGVADSYFVLDKNGNGLYDPKQFGDPKNEYLGGSFDTGSGDRGDSITLDQGTYFLWTYLHADVSTGTPYTLTIQSYTDSVAPTATADTTDLTTAGAKYVDFAVTYTDDHAMSGPSARYDGAIDIHVDLDSGFSYDTYWFPDGNLNPAEGQDATSETIRFRIFGPEDGYTAADNGVYTLMPRAASPARDVAGNGVPATPIGSYRIAIGVVDTIAPTAAATLAPVLVPGGSGYEFTVAYTDNRGLDATTIGGDELTVTGPHGFIAHATLVAPLGPVSVGGSTRVATYRFDAPGGTWGSEDDGQYTISLAGGKVKDAAGNAVAAKTLGTVTVHVPYPGDANGDDVVDFNDLVALAQNYNTYGKGVATGDFNFDGIVDFTDLVLLAQHYNTTLPASALSEFAPPLSVTLPATPPQKTTKAAEPVKPVFAVEPIKPAPVKKPAATAARKAGH